MNRRSRRLCCRVGTTLLLVCLVFTQTMFATVAAPDEKHEGANIDLEDQTFDGGDLAVTLTGTAPTLRLARCNVTVDIDIQVADKDARPSVEFVDCTFGAMRFRGLPDATDPPFASFRLINSSGVSFATPFGGKLHSEQAMLSGNVFTHTEIALGLKPQSRVTFENNTVFEDMELLAGDANSGNVVVRRCRVGTLRLRGRVTNGTSILVDEHVVLMRADLSSIARQNGVVSKQSFDTGSSLTVSRSSVQWVPAVRALTLIFFTMEGASVSYNPPEGTAAISLIDNVITERPAGVATDLTLIRLGSTVTAAPGSAPFAERGTLVPSWGSPWQVVEVIHSASMNMLAMLSLVQGFGQRFPNGTVLLNSLKPDRVAAMNITGLRLRSFNVYEAKISSQLICTDRYPIRVIGAHIDKLTLSIRCATEVVVEHGTFHQVRIPRMVEASCVRYVVRHNTVRRESTEFVTRGEPAISISGQYAQRAQVEITDNVVHATSTFGPQTMVKIGSNWDAKDATVLSIARNHFDLGFGAESVETVLDVGVDCEHSILHIAQNLVSANPQSQRLTTTHKLTFLQAAVASQSKNCTLLLGRNATGDENVLDLQQHRFKEHVFMTLAAGSAMPFEILSAGGGFVSGLDTFGTQLVLTNIRLDAPGGEVVLRGLTAVGSTVSIGTTGSCTIDTQPRKALAVLISNVTIGALDLTFTCLESMTIVNSRIGKFHDRSSHVIGVDNPLVLHMANTTFGPMNGTGTVAMIAYPKYSRYRVVIERCAFIGPARAAWSAIGLKFLTMQGTYATNGHAAFSFQIARSTFAGLSTGIVVGYDPNAPMRAVVSTMSFYDLFFDRVVAWFDLNDRCRNTNVFTATQLRNIRGVRTGVYAPDTSVYAACPVDPGSRLLLDNVSIGTAKALVPIELELTSPPATDANFAIASLGDVRGDIAGQLVKVARDPTLTVHAGCTTVGGSAPASADRFRIVQLADCNACTTDFACGAMYNKFQPSGCDETNFTAEAGDDGRCYCLCAGKRLSLIDDIAPLPQWPPSTSEPSGVNDSRSREWSPFGVNVTFVRERCGLPPLTDSSGPVPNVGDGPPAAPTTATPSHPRSTTASASGPLPTRSLSHSRRGSSSTIAVREEETPQVPDVTARTPTIGDGSVAPPPTSVVRSATRDELPEPAPSSTINAPDVTGKTHTQTRTEEEPPVVRPTSGGSYDATGPAGDSGALVADATGMSDTTATAVVGTATSSAFLVSVVAPVSASRAARAGSVSRIARCIDDIEEDTDDDEEERLPLLEMPFPLAIGASPLRWLSGAQLVASGVQAILVGLHVTAFTHAVLDGRSPLLAFVRVAAPLWIAYFGPVGAGVATTVLVAQSARAAVIDTIVALVGVIVQIGTHAVYIWLVVTVLPRHVSETRPGVEAGPSAANKVTFVDVHDSPDDNEAHHQAEDGAKGGDRPRFADAFAQLFDAGHTVQRASVRLYFMAECAVGALFGALTSADPRPGLPCTVVTWLVVVLSGVLLAYFVLVRPYRTRLDAGFALVLAGAQLVVALALALSQRLPSLLPAAGWALVVLSAGFFAQAVAAAVWTVLLTQRRRNGGSSSGAAGSSSSDASGSLTAGTLNTDAPLLAVPVAVGNEQAVSRLPAAPAGGGGGAAIGSGSSHGSGHANAVVVSNPLAANGGRRAAGHISS